MGKWRFLTLVIPENLIRQHFELRVRSCHLSWGVRDSNNSHLSWKDLKVLGESFQFARVGTRESEPMCSKTTEGQRFWIEKFHLDSNIEALHMHFRQHLADREVRLVGVKVLTSKWTSKQLKALNHCQKNGSFFPNFIHELWNECLVTIILKEIDAIIEITNLCGWLYITVTMLNKTRRVIKWM